MATSYEGVYKKRVFFSKEVTSFLSLFFMDSRAQAS
jgi:hypothetical protein